MNISPDKVSENEKNSPQMNGINFYLRLFWTTFKISAFTFGGGFVIISLLRREFVYRLKWLDEKELLNLTAISQCSPGAVAVNASCLIGYRLAGAKGAVITIFSSVLPPFLIIMILSFFYQIFITAPIVQYIMLGMQAGVAAVLADIAFTLVRNNIKQRPVIASVIIAGVFIAVWFFSVNIFAVIIACAAAGVLFCREQAEDSKK